MCLGSIILTGGSTLFPRFAERMYAMVSLLFNYTDVRICTTKLPFRPYILVILQRDGAPTYCSWWLSSEDNDSRRVKLPPFILELFVSEMFYCFNIYKIPWNCVQSHTRCLARRVTSSIESWFWSNVCHQVWVWGAWICSMS